MTNLGTAINSNTTISSGNRKRSASPMLRGLNAFMSSKFAAYNRAMQDNTIAMSIDEGTDYTPAFTPGAMHLITFTTTEIQGRMYHEDTPYFRPQVEGQYDVDVSLMGEIPIATEGFPNYGDNLVISAVRLYLVKKAHDNTLEYVPLGAEFAQRYYDARIAGMNYTVLTNFNIQASVTVDHKVGTSYALAFSHNGLGTITTMTAFYAYMSMHYYGKALREVTDGTA